MSDAGGDRSGVAVLDEAMREQFTWYVVAKKEFNDAVRSKGLWALSAVFTLLFVLPAGRIWWNQRSSDQQLGQQALDIGMQFFISRFYLDTVTLLVTIVVLFVGYAAVTKEKESGSLKLLLSLPFTRRDVIVGKVLGRSAVAAVPAATSTRSSGSTAKYPQPDWPPVVSRNTPSRSAVRARRYARKGSETVADTSTGTRAPADAAAAVSTNDSFRVTVVGSVMESPRSRSCAEFRMPGQIRLVGRATRPEGGSPDERAAKPRASEPAPGRAPGERSEPRAGQREPRGRPEGGLGTGERSEPPAERASGSDSDPRAGRSTAPDGDPGSVGS